MTKLTNRALIRTKEEPAGFGAPRARPPATNSEGTPRSSQFDAARAHQPQRATIGTEHQPSFDRTREERRNTGHDHPLSDKIPVIVSKAKIDFIVASLSRLDPDALEQTVAFVRERLPAANVSLQVPNAEERAKRLGPESVSADVANFTSRPKGETAPAFIKRVYGKWLLEMSRQDLKRVNEPAYRGLYAYESKLGRRISKKIEGFELPTRSQAIDRELEVAGALKPSDDERRRRRLREAAARRLGK